MKERGIIMCSSMVNAILEGRKTQTRRVVTLHNSIVGDGPRKEWDKFDFDNAWVDPGPSPAGNLGPYLKVPFPAHGTVHRIYPRWAVEDQLYVRETWSGTQGEGVAYRATEPEMNGEPWKPSIHMPKWAARIWLEIEGARVERVQEISEEDAFAEGILTGRCYEDGEAVYGFRELWDSINTKRGYGWEVNPWVWVLEFKRVKP